MAGWAPSPESLSPELWSPCRTCSDSRVAPSAQRRPPAPSQIWKVRGLRAVRYRLAGLAALCSREQRVCTEQRAHTSPPPNAWETLSLCVSHVQCPPRRMCTRAAASSHRLCFHRCLPEDRNGPLYSRGPRATSKRKQVFSSALIDTRWLPPAVPRLPLSAPWTTLSFRMNSTWRGYHRGGMRCHRGGHTRVLCCDEHISSGEGRGGIFCGTVHSLSCI